MLSRYTTNMLQRQPHELYIRAQTEDIRWAGVSIVPLKMYLSENPIMTLAR